MAEAGEWLTPLEGVGLLGKACSAVLRAAKGEDWLSSLLASRNERGTAKVPGGRKSQGTPRRNVDQNKMFNDAIRRAERELGRKLSKDERQTLHREVSGQNYGFHEIVEEVLNLFGG